MAEINGEANDHGPVNCGRDIATKTCATYGSLEDDSTYSNQQVKWEMVQETANFLLSRTKYRPRVAIILGSGLGGVAGLLHNVDEFLYRSIPNFIQTTVKGHSGRLLFGDLAGKSVVCMQGRIHAYEGHSMWQTTFPVRVFHAIGVRVMFVTNTSGSLRADFSPGDIVVIKDHINFPGMTCFNPLFGLNDKRFGERFLAMSNAYDPKLRALAHQVADELGMKSFVREGVYFYVAGPCYETIAEIRMARCLGGDVVGMSTCPEVIVARHGQRPMRCVGLSLVTNRCPDDYEQLASSDHDDVLDVADQRADDIQRLVSALLARISID